MLLEEELLDAGRAARTELEKQRAHVREKDVVAMFAGCDRMRWMMVVGREESSAIPSLPSPPSLPLARGPCCPSPSCRPSAGDRRATSSLAHP